MNDGKLGRMSVRLDGELLEAHSEAEKKPGANRDMDARPDHEDIEGMPEMQDGDEHDGN